MCRLGCQVKFDSDAPLAIRFPSPVVSQGENPGSSSRSLADPSLRCTAAHVRVHLACRGMARRSLRRRRRPDLELPRASPVPTSPAALAPALARPVAPRVQRALPDAVGGASRAHGTQRLPPHPPHPRVRARGPGLIGLPRALLRPSESPPRAGVTPDGGGSRTRLKAPGGPRRGCRTAGPRALPAAPGRAGGNAGLWPDARGKTS